MVRQELHTVRRPFLDCTSFRRPVPAAPAINEALHLHAELTRELPKPSIRYSGVKVAARLSA